jgi:hypothetical protein
MDRGVTWEAWLSSAKGNHVVPCETYMDNLGELEGMVVVRTRIRERSSHVCLPFLSGFYGSLLLAGNDPAVT